METLFLLLLRNSASRFPDPVNDRENTHDELHPALRQFPRCLNNQQSFNSLADRGAGMGNAERGDLWQ